MGKNKNSDEIEITPDKPMSSKINWFPGHMVKAIRKIKEHIKSVDIILEIRDARAPYYTGNEEFNSQLGNKIRLIVFNKVNLANPERTKNWKSWYSSQEDPFIFVNGLDKSAVKKIVEKAQTIIDNNILRSNPDATSKERIKMMVVGLPNTGKSTIINKLSNRDASKVADKPGQTKQPIWVKVNNFLEILDTPGVMPPSIHSDHQAFSLSSIHAIPEHIIDSHDTACFLVNSLLELNPDCFQKFYDYIDSEKTLISTFDSIAKRRGCLVKKGEYDYERVYKLIVADFRAGSLGNYTFGEIPK